MNNSEKFSLELFRHMEEKHGFMFSGNNVFVGSDDKRRNRDVLHVNFGVSGFTAGNYALFYAGTQKTLENAVKAISELLTGNVSEKRKNTLYYILVKSLWIVHHVNTIDSKGKEHHSKLNGINSLSTCCLVNRFCLDRIKVGDNICSHCYAAAQQSQQYALQDHNIINSIILQNIVIPAKYWKKYINPADISKYFRIESFGDVANKTQAINYIEFVKAFPRVHFAAWSKNIGIWSFAFLQEGKPRNLSFVCSSLALNKAENYHKQTYDFIDHIFTVYEKDYITANNININCGGRACMECIKKHKGCYFTDTELNISEQLK